MFEIRPVKTKFDPNAFLLRVRGRTLDCTPGKPGGTHVMGILNVTPDSFSDGGAYVSVPAAVRRVGEMLDEGASIIDIGGESSRPRGKAYGAGAAAVPAREEIQRVLPVVEAAVDRFPEAILSIDTWKPEVAEAALAAGAHIVNDVTGLRYTTETATVAAGYNAPLVLMHAIGKPGDMPAQGAYADVAREVSASLADSVRRAEEAGVRHIIVDPGFGFGKSHEENLQLLGAAGDILELGRPVMIGVSRKSAIGALLGAPDEPVPIRERLFGSLGATAVGVLRGASVVRAHDVRPTAEFLRGMYAVLYA